MCGEYTDYTRSYHHPGAQFWVGSSQNWSVFLEWPNTGRHEKAPVRCPCSRLAALHGAPRMMTAVTLLTQAEMNPTMRTTNMPTERAASPALLIRNLATTVGCSKCDLRAVLEKATHAWSAETARECGTSNVQAYAALNVKK